MTVSERTYQVIIGVLVLIILIGGWLIWTKEHVGIAAMFKLSGATSSSNALVASSSMTAVEGESGTTPTSSASGQSAPTAVAGTNESVEVYDQLAGMQVAVQSLTLEQPGWVAVRDAGGRILGAAWFPAGTMKYASVPLLRATVAGARYQILLYADDGDRAFDLHKDTLLTGADGSVAGANFSAK